MTETNTLTQTAERKPETYEKPRSVFMPRADILETKDAVVILADMPGVDEKNLDITLEKNVLTIKGTTAAKSPENFTSAYAEYDEGDYERSFTLGDDVSRENIQASIKNGVLKVELAKAGPAQARKIEVKA